MIVGMSLLSISCGTFAKDRVVVHPLEGDFKKLPKGTALPAQDRDGHWASDYFFEEVMKVEVE